MRLGLIVLLSTSISAQVLSVGAKGGLPLTDAMNAAQIFPGPVFPAFPSFGTCNECATQRTVPYMIGPAAEVHLKGPFSLEVDALYSRVDYNHTSGNLAVGGNIMPFYFASFTSTKHVIDRWEFPILAKYKINTGGRIRPFVEGGLSIQHNRERETEGLTGSASLGIVGPPSAAFMLSGSPVVNSSVIEGATIGIGASFGAHRVRPSLEFRYTRWFDKAFTVGSPFTLGLSLSPPHTAYSTMNQAQLLLGIMF